MNDGKPGPRPEADGAAQACPVSGMRGDPSVERPPVTDWRTDWDRLDPRWRDDPFPIWDALSPSPMSSSRSSSARGSSPPSAGASAY